MLVELLSHPNHWFADRARTEFWRIVAIRPSWIGSAS